MHRVKLTAPVVDAFISRFSAQPAQPRYICRQCARLRANTPSTATFSTSTRRRIGNPTTWDGLPWIGGEEWAKNAALPEKPQLFRSQERVQDPSEIQSHLLNALVEVRLAQQAGEELNWSLGIQDPHWPQGVQVVPSENGGFDVTFASESDREALLDLLTGTEVELAEFETESIITNDVEASATEAAQESPIESTKAEKLLEEQAENATQEDSEGILDEQSDSLLPVYARTTGNGWTNISLQDPNFKFLLLKRLQQRLGNPIPDSRLHSISTLGQVANLLSTKERPKKLHEAIKDNARLLANSNIQIHQKRVSPIDKEKTIGRWKVIEKELNARGLPVTGHSY